MPNRHAYALRTVQQGTQQGQGAGAQFKCVQPCLCSGHRAPEGSSRPADREERLWERSERLWERELARWDSERRAWDAREAQLLQQIADLQHQLLRFAHTQAQPALAQRAEAQRVPGQLAAPAPALVQDGQAYSAQQAPEGLQESHVARVAPSAPLPDPEEVAAAIYRGASGAARPWQSAPEQFLEGDLDMDGPAPFAEDFAAAMDAVNSSDVLGDWQDVLRGKVGRALAGVYVGCHCLAQHVDAKRRLGRHAPEKAFSRDEKLRKKGVHEVPAVCLVFIVCTRAGLARMWYEGFQLEVRHMYALHLQQIRLQCLRKATLQASQQVSRICALSLHAVMAKGAATIHDEAGLHLSVVC